MFPPPPDGAKLADRPTRHRWCSRLEIAYALPREGLLWWSAAPGESAHVEVTAETWTATGAHASAEPRTGAVQPDQLLALRQIWHDAWLAPVSDDDVRAFVHYRGLFRTLDAAACAPLERAIDAFGWGA